MSLRPKVVNFDFIVFLLIKLVFRQNEAGGFYLHELTVPPTTTNLFLSSPLDRVGHRQQTLKW